MRMRMRTRMREPGLKVLKYHSSAVVGPGGRAGLADEFLEDPSAYDIVITTPQMAHSKEEQEFVFNRVRFDYLICDEAHNLKNSGTCAFQNLTRFVKCRRRLLLTGTPIQNSLAQLATLIGFALSSKTYPKVSAELRQISEEPESKALGRLQAYSATLILRRLKADVLELPPKRGIIEYCDLNKWQKELYAEAMTTSSGKTKVKEAYHRLRRICLHPLLSRTPLSSDRMERFLDQLCTKRPDYAAAPRARAMREVQNWSDFERHQAAVQYGLGAEFIAKPEQVLGATKVTALLRILERNAATKEKTLVFSQFTMLLDIVQEALRLARVPCCRLDGTVSLQDRSELVSTFQDTTGNSPATFLISLKAGGVGLNLTSASCVVMLDLDFNPQNTRQAEDRVHRLGQTKEVSVHYLVCRDTVEELVVKRCLAKMRLDRQFGGREGALEAAAQAEASGADEDAPRSGEEQETAEQAAAHAKKCEQEVMADLKNLLTGKPGRAGA